MGSSLPKPGPAWHVQLKIWLLTGELYVRLGKCEEALACAQEAALLSPASHHVMYLVLKTFLFLFIWVSYFYFALPPLAWPHS